MAKDIGKHFRQTPIETTRKILARKHSGSVQIDISTFLPTDIGRKEKVLQTEIDRKEEVLQIDRKLKKQNIELQISRSATDISSRNLADNFE